MPEYADTSFGLWVDLPKGMVLTQEFYDWFAKELRFDLMSFMIDDSDRKVDFSWGPKDVEKALKLAYPQALEQALTTWPYPDLAQLKVMEQKMDLLLGVGPVAEWETDEEFNWNADQVQGFTNLDKAGDFLVDMKRRLCQKHGCRNTMTTFTQHAENGTRADTAPHMDRLMVQAYGIDERDGKPIAWGHRFAPGKMEPFTLDRTMKVPGVAAGKPEVGIGHAAWAQDDFMRRSPVSGQWEKVPPAEAMQTSFDASLSYRLVAHNWWSAKYVYPKSPRYLPYAERFLRSLRADVAARP